MTHIVLSFVVIDSCSFETITQIFSGQLSQDCMVRGDVTMKCTFEDVHTSQKNVDFSAELGLQLCVGGGSSTQQQQERLGKGQFGSGTECADFPDFEARFHCFSPSSQQDVSIFCLEQKSGAAVSRTKSPSWHELSPKTQLISSKSQHCVASPNIELPEMTRNHFLPSICADKRANIQHV